jgi:hypothetical protein
MPDLLDLLGRPIPGEALIFGGPSGSGKTEIAVNLALSIVQMTDLDVMLCDLDVVKPYFRLRDMVRLLPGDKAERMRVIEPEHRFLHADIPIFPSNLHALLSDEKMAKVVDVGGDAAGVGAVAQFRETILAIPHRFYVVINTLRPGMHGLSALQRMLDAIRRGARLEVTGLVSNTNLQEQTTAADVQEGFDLVQKLGNVEGLPVVAVLASHEYASALEQQLSLEAAARLAVIRVFNRILDSVGSQTEF